MPPRQLLAGVQRARLSAIPAARASLAPLAHARAPPVFLRPAFRTLSTSRRVLSPGQREDLEHKMHDSQAAASFHGALM
jgi:hypothetical protein